LGKRKRDPGQIDIQSVNSLTTAFVLFGDACLGFKGTMRAGSPSDVMTPEDFFYDLKRISSPQGPIFRKGSRIVTEYPDEVSLYARAWVTRCSKDMRYLGEWPTRTPDFVRGLRAEAGYIRDLRLHPLEINLAEEGTVLVIDRICWGYHFVMKTKGVRLTDTLVVSLWSREGTKMGEFWVALAGNTGLW